MDTKSANDLKENAKRLYREGDLRAALDCYSQALSQDNQDPVLWAGVAACFSRLDEYQDAAESYRRAIRLRDNVASYHTGLAYCERQLSNFDEAIEHHKRAIDLDPQSSSAHAALARTLHQCNRSEDAIQHFRTAIELSEPDSGLHAGLSSALTKVGDDVGAIAELEEAVKLRPHDADLLVKLANALRANKNIQKAIDCIDEALDLKPDRAAWQTLRDRIWAEAPFFSDHLSSVDGDTLRTRIYIAGCGRSGTWLLDSMMTCFADTWHGPAEFHFGRFANIDAPERVHVVKRISDSFRDLDLLPANIKLLYIIRHPFDVLTSTHIDREYYITPDRWKAEIAALKKVRERPNSMFIKFEDLVTSPSTVQRDIASFFDLTIETPFEDFFTRVEVSEHVSQAMNGLRRPDVGRVERYRRNPEFMSYCEHIAPALADELLWLKEQFGYEYPSTVDDILSRAEVLSSSLQSSASNT